MKVSFSFGQNCCRFGASLLLLVQVPFWCKQQQQSGARVVLPPHRRAAVVEAGKVWSKLCETLSPRALLGSKTHTGETCSATLSLSPALCPETSSHRPPPLSPLPSTFSPSPSQHCPPKNISYEMAFSTFSLIERAFGCNSSFLHFFL